MRFKVFSSDNDLILSREYFSIGGGFVLDEDEIKNFGIEDQNSEAKLPYPFTTADELFGLCKKHNLTIAKLVTQNELTRKTKEELYTEALEIIEVMHISVVKGVKA